MLPALDIIGVTFGVNNANDVHFIVTAFFPGMAVGQLIVGPSSDSFGLKPIIHIGYGIFIIGCLLSMLADSWVIMLFGRVLQGFGAAAPRIVSVAMVRDEFEGRAMARILSIVMTFFIFVPTLTPVIGQGLIYTGSWQLTFAVLALLAVVASVWLHTRQRETLHPVNKRPLHLESIWNGL